MKQLLLDIQPPAPQTLANFIVGNNAEALHSLEQALNAMSEVRILYLWGTSGCGKTHLIHACQRAAAEKNITLHVVDDVHTLDEAGQIKLFNLFNQLRASDGILIATGIATPNKMGLREDLATRLAWGLVYRLHPLTDKEKARAIKTYAKTRGIRLPDDVVDYCLQHLRRDLPTQMALLDALDVWSLTEKKPVTVPILKKLLQLEFKY